ncbi:MAG: TatD family hydrolase [Spirochaetes bacterium]|nr:TatD family hydrolase [Spirochaetota bacterium]
MFIDTHTHLHLITKNEKELDKVIQTCFEQNVRLLFNISVDVSSNLNNADLSEKYNGVFFTAGIHPSEADKVTPGDLRETEKVIKHNKCIGIGETGLDLFRQYASLEDQKKLFRKHIEWALAYNKPLVIHSRDSFDQILSILEEYVSSSLRGVFHCFSYGYEQACQCIQKGFFISFAGNLTYPKASLLQGTAKKTPLEHIILETDSPYLSPQEFRGKTNYPYYIIHTYNFLSRLLNTPINTIEKQIATNVNRLFFQ